MPVFRNSIVRNLCLVAASTAVGYLQPAAAQVSSAEQPKAARMSHAVFDLLKIPVFGREEDAVDALVAFVLLQFGKDVARRTITGTAYFWSTLAAGRALDKSELQ